MNPSFAFAILSACATVANAGIVITPVFAAQIVEKLKGDCFFGEVTPQGCGPKRG